MTIVDYSNLVRVRHHVPVGVEPESIPIGASDVQLSGEDLFLTLQEVEALCTKGLRRVVLQPRLDDLPDATLRLQYLRLLRDLSSCSVSVSWRCSEETLPAGSRRLLVHLSPPDGDLVWASQFRFGALYWRRGPGFLFIKDARTVGATHYILDEPTEQDLFQRFSAPQACTKLTRLEAQVFEGLAECGFLFIDSGYALSLPYRMKHWPIPFKAI